jgi:hypothetical protein
MTSHSMERTAEITARYEEQTIINHMILSLDLLNVGYCWPEKQDVMQMEI